MRPSARPVISLIGFRQYVASRRFLHEVRAEILATPAGAAVDIYPAAAEEQQEGFPDPAAVTRALGRPAALTVVSGHCAADDHDGGSRKRWWIGGRPDGPGDRSWYVYVAELPAGGVGATGGLILDCCDAGSSDFFEELRPGLHRNVPCLGVDGESAPRGTRHLTFSVLRRLLDTASPDLRPGRVGAVMDEVAEAVGRLRSLNQPCVHVT